MTTSPDVSPDVIVIGGGAIGAACAQALARAGRSVMVLDRGAAAAGAPGTPPAGDAWRASAGMLAPQIEVRHDEALFDLGLAGRELYAALAETLRESTGIDIGLWQEGIARVAVSEADAVEVRSAVAWQRQKGHIADWLDAGEVRARWPWLGPTCGALWAPRDGALQPTRLVEALLADAAAHGARVVQETVTALEHRGPRVTTVVGASGECYHAEQVVVAAGAWSGRLAGLPRPLSVEPVRGQIAAVPWPAAVPRAIIYHRGGYLLARGDEALVGSTMEYVGYDAEVTAEGIASLFNRVSALCPQLQRADVQHTWAGLRPLTPDGRPIIGRAPLSDNLWYATGHGRNGILFAAITGQLVAQLLAGETPEQDLAPMSPERFWRW
ncbi:MAG TPA: glycine oxidase ThiO [Gemmatimonadales bacterium]|nr:glycine oxidase ThiO [Gemmatimonadales bacterium]